MRDTKLPVRWAMSPDNDTALALAALHRAVGSRRALATGLVHHTDRRGPSTTRPTRRRLPRRDPALSIDTVASWFLFSKDQARFN